MVHVLRALLASLLVSTAFPQFLGAMCVGWGSSTDAFNYDTLSGSFLSASACVSRCTDAGCYGIEYLAGTSQCRLWLNPVYTTETNASVDCYPRTFGDGGGAALVPQPVGERLAQQRDRAHHLIR